MLLPGADSAQAVMPSIASWLALLLCVVANINANLAFKRFMIAQPMDLTWPSAVAAATNPWLWAGGVSAAIVLGSYLYAIRALPLGVAYPLVTGVAVAGVALAGNLLFGEALGAMRLLGIALVIGGVMLIAGH